MKKTLTVLCFAMCATLAFAQVNNKANKANVVKDMQATKMVVENDQAAGYNASIFSKAGGDVIFTNDFATAPTVGNLSATDIVNGAAVGTDYAHTQTAYSSIWRRWEDTTSAYVASMATNYPAFAGSYFSGSQFPFRSATPTNGYMVLAMLDQYGGWGGHGNAGNFNTWFAVGSLSTAGVPLVDIRFYQYYRKFNRDQCFIDYSTDGTSWTSVEINVRGIDIEVNDITRGYLRTTLPAACAGQANLSLRIRWQSNSNAGGIYGYWWAVDDVQVIESPANSLTSVQNQYFEGFYQMIPQGLQVPMVWNAKFKNTGYANQTNVRGTLNTMESLSTPSVVAATVTLNQVNSGVDTNVLVDPKGWWAANGFGFITDDPTANTPSGPTAILPTQNAGMHFVFGDITTNAINHIYDSITYDTIGYTVNGLNNGTAVWARDNGVLTKFSYFIYGMVSESSYSSGYDNEEIQWDEPGYTVLNSYVTGDNVPAGWRIKGVELVASTYPGGAEAGVNIAAMLRRDSCVTTATGQSVYFLNEETGANTYYVQQSDLNNTNNLEYATPGSYNTITIDFPNQPELLPNTAYRIGYQLAENGYFSVAANRNFYYTLDDTTATWFGREPGMEGYSRVPGVPNPYTTIILDPYDATWHFFSWDAYPMIRMIVGPYEERPMTTVSFECGENGAIYDLGYNDLCGTTLDVIANSSQTYVFVPETGYIIDQIFENGEVVFTNDESDEDNFIEGEATNRFSIGSDPSTIRCTFKEYRESIDPVAANVTMKLQPNPATSATQLTIAGVEGMVNVAIIDMSGRVIRNIKMNAETAQTIELNGLAKGAYFVRINNSNFTKVEKLIVK